MDDKGIRFNRDYGLITVDAYLLGKNCIRKLLMVVDTGAFLTLIDPDVARLLKYSENDSLGRFQVSSPIGVEKGYRIKVKRFEIGNQHQDDFEVGVIGIHESYGIDGLVGLNFLQNYNIQINFDVNKLFLFDKSAHFC